MSPTIDKKNTEADESMEYIKRFLNDPTVQRDFDRDAWEIYCAKQKGRKEAKQIVLEESPNILSKLGYDNTIINEFIKKVKEDL